MAPKRRGKRGIFWVKFKAGGQRIYKSTGTADLELAKKREAELRKDAYFAQHGWKKAAPTFAEWAKKYEETYTPKKAKRTQLRDADMLKRLREYFGNTPLDQITRTDCEAYVNWRRAKGSQNSTYKKNGKTRPLAEGTITREVSFAHAVLQVAVDDDIIAKNPWKKVRKACEPYATRQRVITRDEQPKIEARLTPRFVRFFRFLLGTGVRLDEARTMERGDIDLVKHSVHVVGKFEKERDVPLAPEVEDVLREQLAADRRLWHQNEQRLREVLANAAKRAKVPPISPHVCRHTFATRFLQNGGDIYILSKILGHASVTITERVYAHLLAEDVFARSRQFLPGIATGGGARRATGTRSGR